MNDYRDWESRITEIYARQADTVWRVCYSFMQNPDDTDDAVQETFMRLMTQGPPEFTDEKHERAWLIVTASNLCRDALKAKARQHDSLDDHMELAAEELPWDSSLTAALLKLKESYKTIVYLYYYEGYSVKEIAEMLNISVAKVKTTLHRARKKMKEILEAENEEQEDH